MIALTYQSTDRFVGMAKGFNLALAEAIKDASCLGFQAGDPVRNWVRETTSPIPGLNQVTRFNDAYSDFLQNLACSRPGGQSDGGGGTVEFPPDDSKGNCPGVLYDIQVTCLCQYLAFDAQTTSTQYEATYRRVGANALPGPIGPLVIPGILSGGLLSTRGPLNQINYGNNQISGLFFVSRTPGLDLNRGSNQVIGEISRTVTRQDGQPDNCPPPDGGGPLPPTVTPPPVIYTGPDGVDITINPRFEFGPINIAPDGTINLPGIVLDIGPDFNFNFNLSNGDVNFNFGGSPGASACCPPEIDNDNDKDNNQDDPPPPANDERFVGCKVVLLSEPQSVEYTEKGDANGPTILIPRVGDISYAIELDGRRMWTSDQPIKKRSSFIPVNAPAVAYDYSIVAAPGYTFKVTPILISE